MATTHNSSPPEVRPPVLKVTRFDLVSAGVIAVTLGFGGLMMWLTALWATNRPAETESFVPVELVEFPGGVEDGSPDETLLVDSPEDVTDDPSMAEVESTEPEVTAMLDNVLELAETANNQAQEQFETDLQNAGKVGSATGTGRRPLGMGGGEKGLPREQRWFVAFAEGGTLDEYARQLETFQIQLGALLPSGKLVYLSNLTDARPDTREETDGSREKRMYMTWQGGKLRSADRKLFEKAGIDITGGILFHFYPKPTEQKLATLEYERAQKANRTIDQIRRTYFVVQRSGSDYSFLVSRQIYFE